MSNQECKVSSSIININSSKPLFYPNSISVITSIIISISPYLVNKFSGSCNNINDPYAKLCAPDVIKDMNIKLFNIMSRINETGHVSWLATRKCKWILGASVCNNEQPWNNDQCKCKGRCAEFIWNPSIFVCKCDKSYDIGEYLDNENCEDEYLDCEDEILNTTDTISVTDKKINM